MKEIENENDKAYREEGITLVQFRPSIWNCKRVDSALCEIHTAAPQVYLVHIVRARLGEIGDGANHIALRAPRLAAIRKARGAFGGR